MAAKGNLADTADGAFRKFWIRLSKPAQEQHKGPAVRNNHFGPEGYLEGAQQQSVFASLSSKRVWQRG